MRRVMPKTTQREVREMGKEKTAPQEQGAVRFAKSHGARTVEVIEVLTVAGAGTEEDPKRVITEYWSKDGTLLAVNDPEH